MSKVLFVNGPVHGHINPTLALVAELTRRGEAVTYFATEEFEDPLVRAGAAFVGYGPILQSFLKSYRPEGNHPILTMMEFAVKMDRVVIPLVLERIKNQTFDYLIHDAMFGAGAALGKILNIPAVCSCSSFAMERLPLPSPLPDRGMDRQLDAILQAAEEIGDTYQIEPPGLMDVFFKKAGLNLVYTSRYFQPRAAAFDDSYQFVGPSLRDGAETTDFPFGEFAGKKVIYISLGTINNNRPNFYRQCFAAFGEGAVQREVKVVLSVGKKIDITSFAGIPDNFIVRNHVPQIEVLKRAAVFISHCGLNSASEALYHQVPIVAVPVANDQPLVASQVERLGAGISLKIAELTPSLLREASLKVLEDERYILGSRRIGASFQAAGGYRAAADQIFKYKKRFSLP